MDANAVDDAVRPLSTLKAFAFFLAVYLYFAGFIYEHYLYGRFGISLAALDIPFYYVLVFSYTVVVNNLCWVILTVVLSCAVAVFSLRISAIRRYSSPILIVLLIALFPILFRLAQSTGNKIAARMRAGELVKPIRFVLKADRAPNYPSDFVKANECDALRLVAETKDAFYVLYQNIGPERALPTGLLYRVPKESVLLTRVLLETTRKPGAEK